MPFEITDETTTRQVSEAQALDILAAGSRDPRKSLESMRSNPHGVIRTHSGDMVYRPETQEPPTCAQ